MQKTHKNDFDKWLTDLNKLKYKTIWGIVNSYDLGLLQARRRVFALSIYDPKDQIEWKNRDDLSDVLKRIYSSGDFKPKDIQKHEKVFDFENKFDDESILSHIKNTPSRIRMINNGLDINKNYKGKISTITTKQDRWPNAGNIKYKNLYPNDIKRKGQFTDRRFITPRECYRLMGFTDAQFNKAKKQMEESCVSNVNARDKLYRQAGNSIAVNSLEMIFYLMKNYEKEIKKND